MSAAKRKSRTTLKDIAESAGVSVTTASYALSGKGPVGRISPSVVDRIQEIAREKDYAPNLLVRSMQSGRTHILGFYSSFRTHPQGDLYYSSLISALEEAAGRRGYNLLIYCRPEATPEEVYDALNGGMCDGVIFFGPTESNRLLELLRQSRLPCVILNHEDAEGALSSVADDGEAGMVLIADALFANGHRRIGALTGGSADATDAARRVGALRHLLEERGLGLAPELIREFPVYTADAARATVRSLLAEPDPPTALFAWHDLAGYYILDACVQLGVDVPGQLSLIGYDGIRWPSRGAQTLTTIQVGLPSAVQSAIDLLDNIIHGKVTTPVRKLQPVHLQPGATLAPLNLMREGLGG